MKPHRLLPTARMFFALWIVFAFLSTGAGYTQQKEGDTYPTRPVTFIIPYPPGAGKDLSSRLIAKEAEKFLGQPVVPVNKTGTAVGTAAIAVAKPDGYTIGISGHHASFLLPLLESVPYHPIRDFKHIMQFGSYNFGIVVKSDSPFKSFKELIAHARQNPGKVTWGAPPGGMAYFITDQIAKKENVQFTHIPYKGSPEMQPALLGGHIDFGVGDFSYSLVEAGQIRVLLVLREESAPEYPKTPVLKDVGYNDIPAPACIFIVAPKGTPDGIVKTLEAAFTKAWKEPAFVKGMKDLRMPIFYRDNKELDEYAARNFEFFTKYLKK